MSVLHLGADGWRARVGSGFDESSVLRMADALGSSWADRHVDATVLVGYDTRRDSRRLAIKAGRVLAGYGLHAVVSDRACPTPALFWNVARNPRSVGGMMLTASEYPHAYGGILACREDGGPLSERFLARVDRRLATNAPIVLGEVEQADLVSAYVNDLVQQVDIALVEQMGPLVVVDSMYGSACGHAQEMFERMGCRVVALHNRPVSDFRGLHPDAREPWVDACEQEVIRSGASFGVVLDGGSERIALIDEEGRLVSVHNLAPMVLEHLARQRGQQGCVVSTVASSQRIRIQAERLGCGHTMVARGALALYREIAAGDVMLASGERGGLRVPTHLVSRDGLHAAAMLTELLAGAGVTLRELSRQMDEELGPLEYAMRRIRMDGATTQRLRNLLPGLNPPEVLGMRPLSVSHADGLRLELPDGSWTLVTTGSGGGAVVCAEAPTARERDALLAWAADFARSSQ